MSQGAIAVIGASSDRQKFGNKCVRAYLAAGWEVYPINLHEHEIEGLDFLPGKFSNPVQFCLELRFGLKTPGHCAISLRCGQPRSLLLARLTAL